MSLSRSASILGHHAPAGRPTWQAALLLALLLSAAFLAALAVLTLFGLLF